jgi:hypothetical protein
VANPTLETRVEELELVGLATRAICGEVALPAKLLRKSQGSETVLNNQTLLFRPNHCHAWNY